MPLEFKLPAVGENITQAEIGNVLVKAGDTITAGQVVAEIETEKAVFELPCPHAGKVAKVHVKSGQSVSVGATLLTIEESAPAEPAGSPASPGGKSAPAASATQPKPVPAPTGSAPAVIASPAELQKPAPKSPASPMQPGAAVGSNSAVATIEPALLEDSDSDIRPPAPAGPATRRLARELGVDLHRVVGNGPGGRITPEDVQAYVRQLTSLANAGAATGPITAGAMAAPTLPDFAQFGPIERQPMSKIMRSSAANLSIAWNVIPHVTQHELADITELEAGRKRFIAKLAAAKQTESPKITMTVLALKAVVAALKAYPHFNASLDTGASEVVVKKYYHIGVAVDTEHGLLVPVIRDADQKSLVELAAELTDLANRARSRKLALADMQGGTFTITNLGGIGGTAFSPIVNYPEVAILGMSRSSLQQVIVDGKPEIRLLLPLSLSYDHRVINGADAARFIVKLASLLSDPFQMLSVL